MSKLIELEWNTHGRDFLIWNWGGGLWRLPEILSEAKFDRHRDRVISLGNLVGTTINPTELAATFNNDYVVPLLGNQENELVNSPCIGSGHRYWQLRLASWPWAIRIRGATTMQPDILISQGAVPSGDYGSLIKQLKAQNSHRPACALQSKLLRIQTPEQDGVSQLSKGAFSLHMGRFPNGYQFFDHCGFVGTDERMVILSDLLEKRSSAKENPQNRAVDSLLMAHMG